jgi:uncharacterized protein YecE (DUF72 family)
MTAQIRIGTSGWSYPPKTEGSWKGVFYPPGKIDELSYYADRFETVEVNSTFYRPPAPGVVNAWAQRTPKHFDFTIKLWQKFTHPEMFARKTGRDATVTAADVDYFKKGLEPLVTSGKLGSLLVQFPPRFHFTDENREHLDRTLKAFEEYPLAVELRHRSWTDQEAETGQILADHGASLVYIDEPKFFFSIHQDFKPVGKIFYLRMHGRNIEKWFRHKTAAEKYNYLYSGEELDPFIKGLRHVKDLASKVYVYMNNHYKAKAVVNAIMLRYKMDQPIDRTFWRGLIDEYPELEDLRLAVEGQEDLFEGDLFGGEKK